MTDTEAENGGTGSHSEEQTHSLQNPGGPLACGIQITLPDLLEKGLVTDPEHLGRLFAIPARPIQDNTDRLSFDLKRSPTTDFSERKLPCTLGHFLQEQVEIASAPRGR